MGIKADRKTGEKTGQTYFRRLPDFEDKKRYCEGLLTSRLDKKGY